jgi:hypothetical protein
MHFFVADSLPLHIVSEDKGLRIVTRWRSDARKSFWLSVLQTCIEGISADVILRCQKIQKNLVIVIK